MNWLRVWATQEERQEISTGPWKGDEFPGVALPHKGALNLWLKIRYKDRWTCAQVVDVGPWCIDDAYWETGKRPRAEIMKGQVCPTTLGGHSLPTVPDGKGGMRTVATSNGAGIDLFPAIVKALGLKAGENDWVEFQIIDPT